MASEIGIHEHNLEIKDRKKTHAVATDGPRMYRSCFGDETAAKRWRWLKNGERTSLFIGVWCSVVADLYSLILV